MELFGIIGKIREFICIPRIKNDFLKNKIHLWQTLNSSLDAIQDTCDAINSYKKLKFPDDPGEKILCLSGLLQSLYVQQDALNNLYNSTTGKCFKWKSDFPNIYKIREIRNDAIGHPSGRKDKTYHFISSGLISHGSFSYGTFDKKGIFKYNEYLIKDLIEEQLRFLSEKLGELFSELTSKDQAYKDSFKLIKLKNIFSDIEWVIINIFEGLSDKSMLGLEMLKIIPEYIDSFEKALNDRQLSIDLYEIRDIYIQINYTYDKLLRYFNQTKIDEEISKLDAIIYLKFLEGNFSDLKKFAKEIDEEFESEY